MIENDRTEDGKSLEGIVTDTETAGINVDFERFIALSRDLYCCLSADGRLLYANSVWTQVLGCSEDRLVQAELLSLTAPEDIPTVTALLQLKERAEASGIAFRLSCSDGSSRPFEWTARQTGGLIYLRGCPLSAPPAVSSLFDRELPPESPGKPEHLPPTARAGQEQPSFMKDLNGLLNGSSYLRAILERTQDAFFANYYERIIDANEAFFDMTGFGKDDLPHIGFGDFVAEEGLRQLYSRLPLLFAQGNDRFEAVNKKRDGSQIDVEVSTCVINADPPITVCFMRDITERKKTEDKLLYAHEMMRYIIEHNRIAVAVHDKNLNYMYVSRPYIELFGLQGREIIGKHHYEIMPTMPAKWKDVHQRVLNGEIIHSGDTKSFRNPDATVVWECRPWYEEDGSIGGLILYIEDVSERKRIEKMLFDEKEHFRTTLLSVGDGVISTDNQGLVTVMNPVAERLTGWKQAEALGQRLEEVLWIVDEQSSHAVTEQIVQAASTGQTVEYGDHHLVVSKSGSAVPAEITVSPIRYDGASVDGAVIVIRDFTEKRQKQRQIEFLSYRDALTGLYNRRYMEEMMGLLNTTESLPLALMVIDVNGLKLTNDAFGHEMGDQLLKTVAGVLKAVCRPTDIIGRMGGDEFLIVLRETGAEKALALKNEILSAAQGIKMQNVIVSLAVGYAVKSTPDQELKTVNTEADNHMYQDKIRFGKAMRSQTIQSVLTNINQQYDGEQLHTERVSSYCEAVARTMGMSEKDVRDIKTAGTVHDIGKIMIPPGLLKKRGRLTKEEFELIKRHPESGYQMLKPVDEYAPLAEYILHHHERWDGKGYPMGLAGKRIPLFSRIISVADAVEAMTGERPYQAKRSAEQAAEELRRCAGSQFDPEIVELFIVKVLGLR